MSDLLFLIAAVYIAVGFLLSLWFVFRAIGRIDPVAAEGSLGFRILIIPGLCVFWPLFLKRFLGKQTQPPVETNAHRRAAGGAP